MNIDLDRDVRPLLPPGGGDRWLNVLLAHEAERGRDRHDRVEGAAGHYTHVRVDAQARRHEAPLVGVTTLMAERLVQYVWTGRKKKGGSGAGKVRAPSQTLQVRVKRESRGKRGRPSPTVALAARGHQLGSKVHQQMADLVYMTAAGFEAKWGRRENGGGVHVNTEALMQSILDRGMVPLRPEFLVYDLARGWATRIDMVALERRTGRLVFLEYKTGYGEGRFLEPDRHLRWREPQLRDHVEPWSPKVSACTQLTLGTGMAAQLMRLPPEAFVMEVKHVDLDVATQRVKHVHTYVIPGPVFAAWDSMIRSALAAS